MSKDSTPVKPRVLVDTTFLLPALGIEVEEEAMKAVSLFRRFVVYYLELGLLEAMWKIVEIVPIEYVDVVAQGLDAIRNTYKKLDIPTQAYVEAYMIHNKGHRDYIDTVYYSTAKTQNVPLLTIDYDFIEFLRKHGYQVDELVYTPRDLEKLLQK